MCVIAFLVTLVSLASAQPKCCTVDQWEALESVTIAIEEPGSPPQITNVGLTLHYDGTNERIAAEETVTAGGQISDVTVIQDYAQKTQYTITDIGCTKKKIASFKKACVPSDATLMGNYYFGSGNTTLNITAYQATIDKAHVTLAVTTTGCYPIEEVKINSPSSVGGTENVNYVNVTDGIRDPSVFTPPSSCDSAPYRDNGGLAISYDGTNQKVAVSESVTVGNTSTNVMVIQDYTKATQYLIINNNCTKTTLGAFKKACVPDEATFVGMYYFGGKANNLAFSAYQVQAQELQVQFGVTVDGCYPVEEIVTGRTGTTDLVETYNYVNITDGIKDPSVFTPPSSCNSAPFKYVKVWNFWTTRILSPMAGSDWANEIRLSIVIPFKSTNVCEVDVLHKE
ncbi:hypothetical protein ScPMuIL_004824 [Solemya velum]